MYALVKINLKVAAAVLVSLALCCAAVITVSAVTSEEGVEIPIVMYHSLLKDEARHGKYVISPAEFENDLQYLKKHGYTTILMSDLIAYTQGKELPEKPVLLTFDDGYYNNYLYAFELAKQYQCKFVISPIGYYADQYTDTPDENAYYSHATWEELQEMAESGLVEVQNHSYNLHKSDGSRLGVKKVSGETETQYESMLSQDLLTAQEKIEQHVGMRPTTFVYPFGAVSKGTPELDEQDHRRDDPLPHCQRNRIQPEYAGYQCGNLYPGFQQRLLRPASGAALQRSPAGAGGEN